MDSLNTELLTYRNFFSTELNQNILPYWKKYGIEKNGHGFYGAVDLDGNPVLTSNKTCVLNARILWTFSTAAMLDGNEEYGTIADKPYVAVISVDKNPDLRKEIVGSIINTSNH